MGPGITEKEQETGGGGEGAETSPGYWLGRAGKRTSRSWGDVWKETSLVTDAPSYPGLPWL